MTTVIVYTRTVRQGFVTFLSEAIEYGSGSGQNLTRKIATLLDLAEALGISIGTVHRALHNQPDVNVLTKTRVLQMAKTMHYRPNLAARSLGRRQGRLAFRVLRQFLVEGSCPSYHVMLSPHLVMRANLDFFQRRQSLGSIMADHRDESIDSADFGGYSLG